MRRRVFDETHDSYPDYGGRGIGMQDSWDTFSAFLSDMGERPPGTTLDRRDPNGDYTVDNCRWATSRQQLLNRRNTQMLTHEGITMSLNEWSVQSGVPYQTLWSRINRHHWPVEKSLVSSKTRPSLKQQNPSPF